MRERHFSPRYVAELYVGSKKASFAETKLHTLRPFKVALTASFNAFLEDIFPVEIEAIILYECFEACSNVISFIYFS